MNIKIIIICILILCIVGYLIYTIWFNKKETYPNSNKKTFLFFYTDWCSYCSRYKSTHKKLTAYINKNMPNVTVKDIDCDKNEDLVKKYGIEGFPTLILESNGKSVTFTGEKTLENLIQFIKNN